MKQLEKKLGYKFKDPMLLKNALTHSSYANENRAEGVPSNERLEFLGDSVLGFVTAKHLYNTVPTLPEGKMTRLRAELVCEHSLYGVAQELELGAYLRMGHGEEKNGGRERASILADATEAVIAAIFQTPYFASSAAGGHFPRRRHRACGKLYRAHGAQSRGR